ncbi:MAG: hypothetical protein AAF330_08165 [Pseudomonadota bacterium]
MGIDLVDAFKLISLHERGLTQGRLLCLGRQGFYVRRDEEFQLLERRLDQAGISFDLGEFKRKKLFSEPFFRALGFSSTMALDASGYEGADIVHDLTAAPLPSLQGGFDFILDGGTIEHVFDVPAAFRNVYSMLATEGAFYSVNGANGFFGHGFYQFSPELPWSFWHRACKFDVLDCVALPKDPRHPEILIPDPESIGGRVQPELPSGRVYLSYTVRKRSGSAWGLSAGQSDYVARWTA